MEPEKTPSKRGTPKIRSGKETPGTASKSIRELSPRFPVGGEIPPPREAPYVDVASLSRKSSELLQGTGDWSNFPAVLRGALGSIGDAIGSQRESISRAGKAMVNQMRISLFLHRRRTSRFH